MVPGSLAPTALPTVEAQRRPVPSLRDRVLVVAAIGAAGLLAATLYVTGVPPGPAGAASPGGSLATLPVSPPVAATASATNAGGEGASPRTGVDPSTLASATAAPHATVATPALPAQRPSRARAMGAPNGRTSSRATDPAGMDSLDMLVEERR